MDKHPAQLNQPLACLVPVSCARHHLHVANAAAVPGHLLQLGPLRAGHHLLRVRHFVPLDARPAVAGVRRRGFDQVGIGVELADQVQSAVQSAALPAALLTTLLDAEAGQFVGSVVAVARQHETPLAKPAQQQAAKLSEQTSRRLVPAASLFVVGLAVIQGHQQRQSPLPARKGKRTSTLSTTHLCPQRKAVKLCVERTGSRWQPLPKTLSPGCSSTVSSPAR